MFKSIDNHKICKYCRKDFAKYECSKLKDKDGFLDTLINIWLFIEIPFVFIFAYLFGKSKEYKLEKKGTVYTCVNDECIGYLDECHE